MREIGTDVLAVACIVGGGIVAGGVTLALAGEADLPPAECVATVRPEADVMVSLGNQGLVVVRPDVRLREARACLGEVAEGRFDHSVVSVQVDRRQVAERARREAERARAEAERVRREADRIREEVERVRERVSRVDVERARRDAERARSEALRVAERLRGLQEEVGEGTRIELSGHGFAFELGALEDLDLVADGLEERLHLQLEALEGLDLELEGLDRDIAREVEQRLEEEMARLRERLERAGDGEGR